MSVNQRSRTYSWGDPNALRDAGSGMSGLEFIQAVFERKLPPPPIAATMDFTGAEAEEGRVVFVGEPKEFHYNPIGVVHGGFATSVNFVRPITKDTGSIRCEASILHRGGRIATAEGKLIAESTGKLLAHGTTTCLVFRP